MEDLDRFPETFDEQFRELSGPLRIATGEAASAFLLPRAGPVRLAGITRIGAGDPPTARWREVSQGHYVHGCLTDEGVYAVYDAAVAMVPEPKM